MSPLPKKHIFAIEEKDIGKRIDKFLSEQIIDISRTKLKDLIEGGCLRLNGEVSFNGAYKLREEDKIVFYVKEELKEHFLLSKKMDLNIIFEDQHLIVLDKPAGLTVHPGAGNRENTLVNGLIYYLGDGLLEVGDVARPGIVHRLDKDTSGLMLVAKTPAAHLRLSEMIAKKEIGRVYHAFVYGVPPAMSGIIKTNIGRSRRDPKKRTVLREGGKLAITYYTLLLTLFQQVSLVECRLETGRTHQIRVHMDYVKCPLIGDQTYGRGKNFNLSMLDADSKHLIRNFRRQALHSKELSFIHPFTEKSHKFISEYSADLSKIYELFCG